MFGTILGNEPIKSYLTQALSKGTLPHALLFSGPEGSGKSSFAKELSCHLLGAEQARIEKENHPDFHVLRPEGKSGLHSIETLRHLIDESHIAPFEAASKVFLIREAHRMQPAAGNALLKTLEEPLPNTLLILLTSALQEILPTIASRCSILRFQPVSKALGLGQEKELFAILASRVSYPELALKLSALEEALEDEDPVKKNLNVERIFSLILMWHRDRVASTSGAPLFFPDAPEAKGPLPDLEATLRAVEEARLAVSRNMRLSTCLERILTSRTP
jgi:DNA polymerase III delta prime subunit